MVNLQAQLESLKAQAPQGYGDDSSISSPQKNTCGKMFSRYLADEQLFSHPTMPSSSIKNENRLYSANEHFTYTSTQSAQGYETDLFMPDYSNTNPSCSVQGYDDMEDLQSVAFAYLNQAWQDNGFGSYVKDSNSFCNNNLVGINFIIQILNY